MSFRDMLCSKEQSFSIPRLPIFRQATIEFKPWKGRVTYVTYIWNDEEDLITSAKKVLEKLSTEKGWKRRKALRVTVNYGLNITI